jgi:hypothetical protein
VAEIYLRASCVDADLAIRVLDVTGGIANPVRSIGVCPGVHSIVEIPAANRAEQNEDDKQANGCKDS